MFNFSAYIEFEVPGIIKVSNGTAFCKPGIIERNQTQHFVSSISEPIELNRTK